jgi:hypothetical protein
LFGNTTLLTPIPVQVKLEGRIIRVILCEMRIALNGATTMRAHLETDFAAAKAAGFDYVEMSVGVC